MSYLRRLYEELEKQCRGHAKKIYNYAIPQSWNPYRYRPAKSIRSRELLVHPYEFYLFALRNILGDADGNWKQPQPTKEKPSSKRDWLKHASVHSLVVRIATAWGHDHDDRLVNDNLYHLNDDGTFLKSILLLPLLEHIGVNTLLLHQIFSLCKTQNAHDYSVKEAVTDFRNIDPLLRDKLVKKLDTKEQRTIFLEACHLLGFRVVLECCPGRLARENSYHKEHPEWFFWFDSDQQNAYHLPRCNALPRNALPFTYALKDFYRSKDVQQHVALFQEALDGLHKFEGLREIELGLHTTVAPSMTDQINAATPAEQDTAIWRMHEDIHTQIPRNIRAQAKPCLIQDIIRYDLRPAKKPMAALQDYPCENICWYQQEPGVDGIFLEKPYLLPEKLRRVMAKAAGKQRKSFVVIAEDTVSDNSPLQLSKGCNTISGNGAYEEGDIQNFEFRSFSCQLKGSACLIFTAYESYDFRRIASVEGNTAAIMLTVMSQFLPDRIPLMMNGVESFRVQPMQLSECSDSKYLNALPKEGPRHRRQAYLDEYWFDYRDPNLLVLPTLLEKISAIRRTHEETVTGPNACIPVQFDSPRDYGIGLTYIMENRALLVVYNTNVHDNVLLHVHTENMICELPSILASLQQIFSTKDPFTHDIMMGSFQSIPLEFDPGEVKFIELKPE